jgi:outer membrane protein assembly factor BamA
MKKNLIAVAALAFTIQFAHAQTEKGNQTLGLNLGYTYSKATEIPVDPASNGGISIQSSKTTTFNIGPSYSYFIANNLDLGVSLFYNNSTQATSQISPRATLSNTNYGGSVFLRKYVLYNNKIGFRTGGSVGYSYNRNKTDYQGNFSTNNTNYKGNVFTGGLLLDLVYYPTTKLGLAANIANATYSHGRVDNGLLTRGTTNDFNFNFINNGLVLSVFYTFGGK